MIPKETCDIAAQAMEAKRRELIALPLARIWPELAEAALTAALSVQWRGMEGAPVGRWIQLWFIGNNAPKAAHMACIGQVSEREPGKVWDGERYKPIEWFSHWAEPLPPPPDQE